MYVHVCVRLHVCVRVTVCTLKSRFTETIEIFVVCRNMPNIIVITIIITINIIVVIVVITVLILSYIVITVIVVTVIVITIILVTRDKDARDFQKRWLPRFQAARASRYASHPLFWLLTRSHYAFSTLPTL